MDVSFTLPCWGGGSGEGGGGGAAWGDARLLMSLVVILSAVIAWHMYVSFIAISRICCLIHKTQFAAQSVDGFCWSFRYPGEKLCIASDQPRNGKKYCFGCLFLEIDCCKLCHCNRVAVSRIFCILFFCLSVLLLLLVFRNYGFSISLFQDTW